VPFELFPAVDVADGRAVRGAAANTDPLQLALSWQSAGATWVHLVDLDAAFGRGSNAALLASVIDEIDVAVQLSGGIHDASSLERALSTGCVRAVLATSSLGNLDWVVDTIAAHGKRVAVALDVRTPDRLVDRGDGIDRGDLWDTIERLDGVGCARYVVTDIERDGGLAGVGVDLCRAVVDRTTTPVIASGGVASIDDLIELAGIAGLEGAIVGTALHAGRFTLEGARRAVAE
jgi:1-(5-phosphoribosyl)-5-[(5-phosphoribosylamino)methylideneamino] imidazole-4-carboxamide isomerase/N-(5'phosphoribosyl)anthranilate isomerase